MTGFSPVFEVRARLTSDRFATRGWSGELSEARITWNDLFSAIGPQMLDESAEYDISERIEEWLTERYATEARARVYEVVEGEGDDVSQLVSTSVSLTPADFGTLIIQLRALGLITKSERPRSVKDTETYWTITPYGDEKRTTLMAIRRKPARKPKPKRKPTVKPKAKSKAAKS